MAGGAALRPARRAAGRLGLEIAGERLFFKEDSGGIITVLARRYAPFVRKTGRGPVLRLTAGQHRASPFTPAVSSAGARLEIARGDFRAVIGGREGTLAAATSEQTLDAFLRSYIGHRLLRRGGLMLHSAGLVRHGRAYIFPGKSGAGKSTLARLAQARGAEVISDEINLLVPALGGWRVFGSPFWGEMRAAGRQASWPLGGVRLLKKASRDELSPCGRGELLKTLLRCTVNFDRSPAAAAQALANAAALLGAARPARLEFARSGGGFLELL